MDAYYTVVILAALIGFLLLAALLLVPVYRFLKREEAASEQWTREALRRRAEAQDQRSENGAAPAQHPEKEE